MFDDKSYLLYKNCELVLAEKKVENLLNKDVFKSYEFLIYFKEYISELVDGKLLSPLMKNNILNYLNMIRFADNEEVNNNNKFSLINDIIRLVNLCDCKKYTTFYRKEMYKRTNNEDYMNLPSSYIVQSEEKLCNSILFDNLVLFSHSHKVDDNSFKCKYIPKIVGNWKYFETINCILEEYPQKFLDDIFRKRYQMVMEEFYNRDFGEPYNYGIYLFGEKVENKANSIKKS